MSKIGRNDPCPCGSGKKYKKCCLARTSVQVGKEDLIREHPADNLLEFHGTGTFPKVTEITEALTEHPPKTSEDDVLMETKKIDRTRQTTTGLTPTAKKIMELFRYFRVKKGEYLSLKLIRNKQHLWQNIEGEQFNEAIDDLIELAYIERIENPAGLKLLDAGYVYLKQLPLYS